MVSQSQILDHAQVVDINGEHIGIVDHFEDDQNIKLAKSDPNANGHHHIIPLKWVKEVVDNKVILTLTRAEAETEWKNV